MKITQAKFYPIDSLENKRNLKKISRIERDGSVVERVYLDVVDPRHREHLICIHYLRHITRNFLKDHIGVNIIDRDNPWDFKIELSNNKIFNIEITSLADNSLQFENNKKEERFNKWKTEENIPLYELKKLHSYFPDQHIQSLITKHEKEGANPDSLIPNPYYSFETSAFISSAIEPEETLESLIESAITKKVKKKHEGKENTILIIDNRSGAFDVPDYVKACDYISPLVKEWPFPEIWFYTGYYSDDDGNNAEFSFSPLKVTQEQEAILKEIMKSTNMDSSGRYVW